MRLLRRSNESAKAFSSGAGTGRDSLSLVFVSKKDRVVVNGANAALSASCRFFLCFDCAGACDGTCHWTLAKTCVVGTVFLNVVAVWSLESASRPSRLSSKLKFTRLANL